MEFNTYLLEKRKLHALTQYELVEQFQNYSFQFEKLDVVTFSRWENGKTIPSLNKRAYAYKFFSDLNKLVPLLQSNKARRDLLSKSVKKRYGSFFEFGDDPYLSSDEVLQVKIVKDKSKLLNVDFLSRFERNVYGANGLSYNEDIKKAESVYLYHFHTKSNSNLGHMVQLNLSFDAFIHSMDFGLSIDVDIEKLLQISQFKSKENNKVVFIPSVYNANPAGFNASIMLIQEFLKNNNDYNLVIVRVARQDIASFYQSIGGEIIRKSEKGAESGIKVGIAKVKWILVALSSIGLLSLKHPTEPYEVTPSR